MLDECGVLDGNMCVMLRELAQWRAAAETGGEEGRGRWIDL